MTRFQKLVLYSLRAIMIHIAGEEVPEATTTRIIELIDREITEKKGDKNNG